MKTIIDLANKVSAEVKLKELGSHYEAINDAVELVDTDGRIVFANAALETMHGFAENELIGKPATLLTFSDDLPTSSAPLKLPFDQVWVGNVKRIRKSGEVFDAHLTSSPVTDGQGKVIGRLGVLLDITLMATGGNKNELNSQSEALAQISRIISSSPDIDEVFDLFAEHARALFSFDLVVIDMVDPQSNTITAIYRNGQDVEGKRRGDSISLDGTTAKEVLNRNRGLLVQGLEKNDLLEAYPALASAYKAGLRSFITVPLRSRDQIKGVLLVRSRIADAYTSQDLRLAEKLGDQIAGVIANVELHKALEIESKEREILAEIGRIISSSPDIDDVFEKFVEQARNLFSFDRIAINRIDQEHGLVSATHRAGVPVRGRHRGDVFPLSGTSMEEAISNNSGVLVQGLCNEDLIEKYPELSNGLEAGLQSYITVPLRSQDQIIGALLIRSKSWNAYSSHDLQLAEMLGDQIAGAIANAELHKDIERRAAEQRALAEIGRIISGSVVIDDVYESFTAEVKKVLPWDRISVAMLSPDGSKMRHSFVSGLDTPDMARGSVLDVAGTMAEEVVSSRSAKLFAFDDVDEFSRRYPGRGPMFELGVRSHIVAPLIVNDRVIGLFYAISRKIDAYDESDRRLAEQIGSQISGAIANSQLHKDIERRAAELHTLAEIGRIINGSVVIDDVYESFTVEVKKILPSDRITIAALSPDGSKIIPSFVNGLDDPAMTRRSAIEVAGTMAEEAIRSRSAKIYVFEDAGELSRVFPGRGPLFELGIRSRIIAPLIANDKVIGLFYAHSKKPDAYDESDRQLAEQIANQIAGALAISDLHATLEREAMERQVLADIGRTMSSSLVIDEVFEQFAELASRVLPFDRIAIAVIDWERQIIGSLHHYGDTVEGRSFGDETPLKGTTVEEAVKRDSGVIIPDMPPEEVARLYPGSAAGVEVGFRSFMAVPLRSRDKIIGAIVLRSYRRQAFDQRDLDLAERMADQIAGAVDGSQLYLELKKTEEALKESFDRFDLATQGSGDGLWDRKITTHGEDGDYFDTDDYVYFSPGFKELLGYKDDEFPNDLGAWYDAIHPEDLELAKQAAMDHFEDKRPYEVEYRARTKSGEYRWFRARGQALWDESGRPIRLMGLMRDVTNQKSLETQLLRSQKMDAFGQLAGGLAHDLNNMLSVVMSYTHLAKTSQISETRELHLGEVLKASERAAELISQLLAFSRRQIIKPRTVDINDVVADVERMLRRLMGEEIELLTKLDSDVPLVEVDPGQIEQVLVNLSVNSRDAMPDGGTLLIETSSEAIDEEQAKDMAELVPGAYTVITVQDTGAGIPEEMKDQVFEPFFTTKEIGQGSGLGLSTCYGIVAQSGGCIVLESVLGEGSTFKIYLPGKEGTTEPLSVRDQSGYLPVGTESILVVEDEPLVRNVAVHVLREQGYSIIEASNGLEALDVASQHRGGPVHLLLTDMVMPVMGGRKLAERLRELHPDIKVLFTSGYTEDEAFKDEVLNERTNFLPKPFNPDTLTRKVREVLQGVVDVNAENDLTNDA